MPSDKKNLSDIWKMKRRGKRDSDRHKKLVEEAIRKNGKDLITEHNIITSDGNKKIKIPIRFLDQYKFKYGSLKNKTGTGQGVNGSPGSRYRIGGNKKRKAQQRAGNEPAENVFEAEITVDELVDILLEELDLPWMEPKGSTAIEIESENLSSIEKIGIRPNLDLKRTLFQNIKRNAAKGKKGVGQIRKEDLRYRTWDSEVEYHSNAAVYLMMDRSGSMSEEKRYIAKSFYFWMVQFLKRRYKNIKLIFIAHDTEASIVSQKEFFTISGGGGTMCSSAFQLAYEHIKDNHPTDMWNNYIFEFSDGDNWPEDNRRCVDLARDLLPLCTAIGYGEILSPDSLSWLNDGDDRLLSNFFKRNIQRTRFVSMQLNSRDDVFDALRMFFNIDGISKNKKTAE